MSYETSGETLAGMGGYGRTATCCAVELPRGEVTAVP
jgi:hypothetical protein